MKNFVSSILTVLFIGALFTTVNAQMGIGTTSPHSSSILELSSTTHGFLLPRMTDAEMNLISSPATGLMIYNTTNSCIYIYNGTSWQSTCTNTSSFWSITGNSSLTGSNFIGSTDATDLNFRSNNVQRMVLASSGHFGIGATTPTNALTLAASSNPLRVLGMSHNALDTLLVIDPTGVVYKRSLASALSTTWSINGNAGTNASSNFIGTTDSVDFVIRVNNNRTGRFVAGTRTFVGGRNSVATGSNSLVYGLTDSVYSSNTITAGDNNKVLSGADFSAVFGGNNILKGTASYGVVTGELNVVEGVHSSAHGENLFVNSYNMVALGSYNDTVTGNRLWVDSTNHLFVVGNGHKFCDRSNVITATWGGNVGIDNKDPLTALDVHGGFSLRPRTTLTEGTVTIVNSNNFPYEVDNRSYLRIESDNSPSLRSIVLSPGLQIGQIIIIECITVGGFDGIRIVDNVGTHNTNTDGTRDLYENDIIMMIWNGSAWTEISYTDN